MPLLAAALAACAPQPEPRTVLDFMEDGLAREGVLTRCNQDRDDAVTDEECANAGRAAAALALEAERARAPLLERESEAKVLALRDGEARGAASFDVYADGAGPLGRHSLTVVAAEPPANDLVISAPQLEVTDLAVVPMAVSDSATEQ